MWHLAVAVLPFSLVSVLHSCHLPCAGSSTCLTIHSGVLCQKANLPKNANSFLLNLCAKIGQVKGCTNTSPFRNMRP